MEPFTRVAFWTVTLFCFVCLKAKPLPLGESNIKQMREHVTCPPESTFYAPSNVEAKCIVNALKCVLLELKGPAESECDDPRDEILPAMEFLNHTISNRTPDNSSECDCHRWPQTNFTQFLNQMTTLLEMDNSIQLSQ